MAVNAKGTFLLSRAVIPHMIQAGSGSVVNQASVAAHVGIPDLAVYSASKGAILALTRSMAVELAQYGVRVNAISPGAVATPLLEGLTHARTETEPHIALGADQPQAVAHRIGEPEEIAQVALFLAGNASSFITGTVVTVDGGRTAR